MITIRAMQLDDIDSVAHVHNEAFKRQLSSKKWVSCNFSAYPRIMMHVAVADENKIVGYIQWIQKSGFRNDAVIELEQIAVLPDHQGNKIGTKLIETSLKSIKKYLATQNSRLKSVLITTRADNYAQRLYEKTLDAKISAYIKDLYSADEVIMIAKIIED